MTPSTLLCPSKDPRQLRATAYFSDSTTLDVTSVGTWTSSKSSICTVNSGGVVTPVAQGGATVTFSYTYGGIARQGMCAVSVSYRTIWYLYMTPAGYTSYNRTPVQFTCQARTTSGWLNITDACQWTSSASTVATVDSRGRRDTCRERIRDNHRAVSLQRLIYICPSSGDSPVVSMHSRRGKQGANRCDLIPVSADWPRRPPHS